MRGSAWVVLGVVLLSWASQAQSPVEDPPALASTLAGRVCEDRDRDGRCGSSEPGLARVRLVLATGREVLTDAQGRYHLTGVDSRTPDATGGLHLRPGRHRLRLDTRSLPPGGQATPEAVTLEVPWGAVVLQDFAVRLLVESTPPLAPTHAEVPPQAEVVQEGIAFVVAGQASPGDRVRVEDTEAEVDADGTYRAVVSIQPGENRLGITATSPGGSVRFFRQRVDVVRREGSWLIAPRAIEPSGAVRLPGGREEEVPSGNVSLRVEAPEGTRVRAPQGEVTVGPEGHAEVPLTLTPGKNPVTLEFERPGEPARKETVELSAVARPFLVGLLDLEGAYLPGDGAFQLRGRGAAHAEARLGDFELRGEVDLRDTDFRTLHSEHASSWLRPRLVERLERSLDPELALEEWGDDSTSLTPNAAEGRLRLEARHDAYGRAGFGTYRALLADREIGRYHHPLFGPFAELKTEAGPARVGVDAFAGSMTDPVRGLAAMPAHEELHATGGSLYFLGASAIVEGSEVLRVELRDGLTGLPLAERHLVRGRDYEIDYFSGRILLARPLSLLAGTSWLRTDALTAVPEPVLVADYAALDFSGSHDTVGGEAWAELAGARLSFAGVRERRAGAPYQLLTGRVSGALGPYTLWAEAARSEGQAIRAGVFGVSDDGGLTFLRPLSSTATGGDALGLRVKGPGPLGGGSVDAAFRWREPGFSDGAHAESALFRQISLRAAQPLGPVRLTLLGDDRRSADPRLPFEPGSIASRTLGLGVGYERESWSARLELRDAWLRASEVPGVGPVLEGGRTSVGLQGRLRVHERVVLSAGHRQALMRRGDGPGRVDDSFSSAGVDLTLDEDTTVGVRGGWGPELGPQVWADASVRRGPDVYYGGYSVDVDGPDFGAGRAVMGARTELEDGTSVFVEDISAHDANAVRVARAVGFQQAVAGGLQVGGRYERGVRHPLDLPSSLTRDAASLFGQWTLARLRVEGRAELRREEGTPVRGAATSVDRLQAVVSLAGEALLREDLSLSGRLNFARTLGEEQLEQRLLEGSTAMAWRPGPWLLVGRYSITRELLPGERNAFGERSLQVFSVLPAVRLGDRFSVAAGLHVGRSSLGEEVGWVWTGTLRPAVRVVGGLELGLEGARRGSAREGQALTALRGEVGYPVDEGLRFAAGYTLLGFSGLGLSGDMKDEADRLYVRAEMAY
ncbi:flagellar motor protein [Hyalangium rubrum]|uniref:Flagellar motor protein n=1 Tax=Hyalangium rubrum TaxID=3103134 RepID=A0ABU5HHG2_9BACT|nr:flagellar motor protein [Hyalangium sp. s54d21]MDY7232582.1 flagellar motor protein [Hyalangium sp. s54d21]